jgi:hypothetical protein
MTKSETTNYENCKASLTLTPTHGEKFFPVCVCSAEREESYPAIPLDSSIMDKRERDPREATNVMSLELVFSGKLLSRGMQRGSGSHDRDCRQK